VVEEGAMDAGNLKRMNADRPGVDLSAFFPAKFAKKRRTLWNVVSF
jgi:hypothetical protein